MRLLLSPSSAIDKVFPLSLPYSLSLHLCPHCLDAGNFMMFVIVAFLLAFAILGYTTYLLGPSGVLGCGVFFLVLPFQASHLFSMLASLPHSI